MESDPTLMCELLVGLGEVDVVGMNDDGRGLLWVTVRSRSSRPVCAGCAGPVWSKGDVSVRSRSSRPVCAGCAGPVWSGRSAGQVGGPPGVWPAGAIVVAKAPLDVSRPHL